jgi:hypothetical protein
MFNRNAISDVSAMTLVSFFNSYALSAEKGVAIILFT